MRTSGLTTSRMRQVWGALLLVGAAAEIVGLVRPQRGDTLSEVQDDTAEMWPLLPVAVGAVAGHWYWKRHHTALFLGGMALGMTLWPLRGKPLIGDEK